MTEKQGRKKDCIMTSVVIYTVHVGNKIKKNETDRIRSM